MERLDISVITIAKNEARQLADVMSGMPWAREYIVVDDGSTDETRTLAAKLGATVVEGKSGDFSALRMLGAQRARSPWLFYIDADERVTPEITEEIRRTMQEYREGISPVAYTIPRDNYYLGAHWPYRDGMIRLMRKDALLGWAGKLHETAQIRGKTGIFKTFLIHRTHRNLEEMLAKTNAWSSVEADLRMRAGHPNVVWWRLLRVMATGFWDSYVRQGGWRAGTRGLIESIYQGFSLFVTYAKLWELQRT
ncbi:glycosyltransferase family 2 protein [Patescibacteria group bacterium]|nr:glycosyltransferase family 2 protein [Patescibacteria group bacterium]